MTCGNLYEKSSSTGFHLFYLDYPLLHVAQPVPAPPPTLAFVTVNPNASPTPTPFQPHRISNSKRRLLHTHSLPSRRPTRRCQHLNIRQRLFPPRQLLHPLRGLNIQCLPCSITTVTSSAVDETVRYTNQTGVTLGEMVMAVEPNLRGGFTLENIMLDGNLLNYDLNGHHLTVYLPQALAPGAQMTLSHALPH